MPHTTASSFAKAAVAALALAHATTADSSTAADVHSGALPSLGGEGGDDQSCPPELGDSVEIDSKATLHYAVVPGGEGDGDGDGDDGLLCGRLEVADHDGWVGFAVSPGAPGSNFMSGSDAIIGIPADDTVLKYDLTDTATVMPTDRQTLKTGRVSQADGKTIVEFAKLLAEPDEVPIRPSGTNIFLHARGGAALGFHTFFMKFNWEGADAAGMDDHEDHDHGGHGDEDGDEDPGDVAAKSAGEKRVAGALVVGIAALLNVVVA